MFTELERKTCQGNKVMKHFGLYKQFLRNIIDKMIGV